MPFPVVIGFIGILHILAGHYGHPINCNTNPDEAVCVYNVNE